MTLRYTFDLEINIDADELAKLHGQAWVDSAIASADEFAQEFYALDVYASIPVRLHHDSGHPSPLIDSTPFK